MARGGKFPKQVFFWGADSAGGKQNFGFNAGPFIPVTELCGEKFCSPYRAINYTHGKQVHTAIYLVICAKAMVFITKLKDTIKQRSILNIPQKCVHAYLSPSRRRQ